MKMIKTNERIEVKNYPYGFRLKTTLTDYMEFDTRKGYRHCTQTIDPRNGRENKPKKSTYSFFMARYFDDKGHIRTHWLDFNGDESINKGCKYLAENFESLAPVERSYLYANILFAAVTDLKATAIFGGSKVDDLKPIYEPFFELCRAGKADPETNFFGGMRLDSAAINATKPENFSPFVVKEYQTILK